MLDRLAALGVDAAAVLRRAGIAPSEPGICRAVSASSSVGAGVIAANVDRAAYTPGAIDARGRIYALNNGELSIFGR